MPLFSRPAGSVKSLYHDAFPKEERYPYLLLKLLSLRRCISFLEYGDVDEKPISFSYTVEGEEMVFILYLAVEENSRSKGYGSEILSLLKNRYVGKSLTLNIEPLDSAAANFSERQKRFAFYERNGFSDTGYNLRDSTMTYMILSTAEDFDAEKYRKTLLGLHPFGIGMPEIKRRADVGRM